MPETVDDQVAQLKNAVAALEAQREILGEAVVEAGLAPHNEITGEKSSVAVRSKLITVPARLSDRPRLRPPVPIALSGRTTTVSRAALALHRQFVAPAHKNLS